MTTEQPQPSPGLAEIRITAASPETARLVAEALGRLFAATDARTEAGAAAGSDADARAGTDQTASDHTASGQAASDQATDSQDTGPTRVHLTVDTTRAPGPVPFRPRLVADNRRRPRP